ncbi:hypothetical protein L226DRAFT_543787 [Lentinus tigrinus ALCF2SS1-7]|uniref:uncharacterized protein n=1 Tax=Lentinus tigrinus ALCF2SS1-7 TaxID=1328758 RepID=UPI001165F3FD|nr:hypothetical protein L226DRAFT_543787 [Lentinus tigrinus ALCF2SS1-7]
MHNLFLGELRHHCIDIWGLKTADKRAKPRRTQVHTPEEQSDVLRRIERGLREHSVKTIERARLDYLAAVARYNNIEMTDNKHTRHGYAEKLVEWVSSVPGGFAAFQLPPPMAQPTSFYRTPTDEADPVNEIFTSSVLKELRHDIRQMYLPSWLEKPPSNIGDTSHGKLKADHWRTLCTVPMVMTLVRLWGTSRSVGQEAQALDNFMHLVAAVDLATRRTMSVDRANQYDVHMEAYIRGMLSIYNVDLVPNHHLCLHLKECLLLFGPTHGWWAFPFERYNGMLQKLKTNQKLAEIPLTFIRYFYVGATLRWIMETIAWPDFPEFREMMEKFREAFRSSRRGTLHTESVLDSVADDVSVNTSKRGSKEQKDLPIHIYDRLLDLINRLSPTPFESFYKGVVGGPDYLSPTAEYVRNVEHNGVTYGTSAHGKRNSFILFSQHVNGTSIQFAGQISQIFYHTRKADSSNIKIVEPFFVVQQFEALSAAHSVHDPYRKFPDVPTWLCYNKFIGDTHLLRLDDIDCHFAALMYTPADIGQECVVVRSLDRVSLTLHPLRLS